MALTWMRLGAAAGVALSALWPFAAAAQDDDKWMFNLQVENDLFAGSDAHYTNGIRLSLLSPEGAVPEWVRSGADLIPMFPIGGRLRVAYSLGQNMYTPSDIQTANPDPRDRPYAGWLYGGIGLVSDTGRRLDSIELDLGVIGPWSQAEPTQKFVHEIIGSPRPQGWDYQLENEPGGVLFYETKWRNVKEFEVLGLGVDFTPHVGAALGNVFTHAAVGGTVRVGRDLPADYGPPRIRPSLPGSGFFTPSRNFGWYLFFGAEGRAVARNIFLDGNTFDDSRSVDKKILVGDLEAGIAITFGDVRLSYTHVYRTEEFHGQEAADLFGTLNLTIRF